MIVIATASDCGDSLCDDRYELMAGPVGWLAGRALSELVVDEEAFVCWIGQADAGAPKVSDAKSRQ